MVALVVPTRTQNERLHITHSNSRHIVHSSIELVRVVSDWKFGEVMTTTRTFYSFPCGSEKCNGIIKFKQTLEDIEVSCSVCAMVHVVKPEMTYTITPTNMYRRIR